ncbi:PREDICTED: xylem cysteine proteinase 1-like [Fragaria vesca subsp. vesca]|uniref:xylem cysteine proteinase 1-like n=1 Tax=Fragaria vesca subsp. vesca TaxID=101020 RepID=UPI0002C33848|nr:PREDICTED: xylem cysteine proteinase 1-like [Fragaria vesca subsp. vesca]
MALIRGDILVVLFILSLQVPCTRSVSQATLSRSFNYANIVKTFEQWTAKRGRVYSNGQEKSRRFAIFRANMDYVHKFNKHEKKTYQLGLNHFSDITDEEILGRQQTGFERMATSSTSFKYQNESDADNIPASIDRRKHRAVTPVKNQALLLGIFSRGSCGGDNQITNWSVDAIIRATACGLQ